MKTFCTLLMSLVIAAGCRQKSEFIIEVEHNAPGFDTLFVKDIITDRLLAKVPLDKIHIEHRFSIQGTTLAVLQVKQARVSYVTIIGPGRKKIISLDSTSINSVKNLPDSLVNYIGKSSNEMLAKHDHVFFGPDNPKRVKSITDSMISLRSNLIASHKSQLTTEELGLLEYQNAAWAYSFLMYYGRMMKKYSPENSFFNFIDSIDQENMHAKTLPHNVLYKFEIQYLRANDSIPNIQSFLNHIESQTKSKDLKDYYKAIYLKDVIENPYYWSKHKQLFTSGNLKEVLEREKNNKYAYLIQDASNSFLGSQAGETAYDFKAQKTDGTELKLSDLRGKIVLVDTWATWCGPCLAQRAKMEELAKKYKDNSKIAFLMISVDASHKKWLNFVKTSSSENNGTELNIPDGMNSTFGEKYLIKAIPKYILIDSKGIIVSSNLIEASPVLEQLIELELSKM